MNINKQPTRLLPGNIGSHRAHCPCLYNLPSRRSLLAYLPLVNIYVSSIIFIRTNQKVLSFDRGILTLPLFRHAAYIATEPPAESLPHHPMIAMTVSLRVTAALAAVLFVYCA